MSNPIKSIDRLIQDQEFMAKSQSQLFENLNIVVENLRHKSDQQNLIVKNQNLIIRNQEIIVDNQINIISNQRHIVDNQSSLVVISKLLGHILNKLKNIDGEKESIESTYLYLEELTNTIREEQHKIPINDPKNLK